MGSASDRALSTVTAILLLVAAAGAGCDAPTERPAPGEIAELEDRRVAASARLIELLESGTVAERRRAAVAMGRIQHPSYAAPLGRAAAPEATAEVRRAALFALGQLGLAEGVEIPAVAAEVCATAAADAEPAIVADGIECLGKLARGEDGPRVVAATRHAAAAVRGEAALALMRFRYAPTWRRETEEPPPFPAAAVEALGGLLADPDADVRWRAAYALSRYGGPGAVAAMVDALGDTDRRVRLFAARGLGRSGGPAAAAIPALAAAARDTDAGVRAEAVTALAALDGTETIEGSWAEDPSFHVRAAVATALGAGDGGGETLLALVRDVSPTVRGAALEALARRRGGDEAVVALIDDALRGDWLARSAAVRAASHLEPARRRDVLERGIADDDRRVRCAALAALGDADDPAPLVAALEDPDLAVRGTAVERIVAREDAGKRDWLERAYEASAGATWVELRETIVAALAALGGDVEVVRAAAAGDAAPSVRARARSSLIRAGFEPPPPREAEAIAPSPWLAVELPPQPRVRVETDRGEMTIRLLPDEAPLHVAAFLERVRGGGYDGLIWHRVVTNFVIQGGDPRGDGWGTGGIALRDEVGRRPYLRGSVGMPKAGKDTGGCQLFITHTPTSHLDGNYTRFGVVEEGLEIVDRIEVGDRIVRIEELPGR